MPNPGLRKGLQIELRAVFSEALDMQGGTGNPDTISERQGAIKALRREVLAALRQHDAQLKLDAARVTPPPPLPQRVYYGRLLVNGAVVGEAISTRVENMRLTFGETEEGEIVDGPYVAQMPAWSLLGGTG